MVWWVKSTQCVATAVVPTGLRNTEHVYISFDCLISFTLLSMLSRVLRE